MTDVEKVDGRDRYLLCGGSVKAEDVIADVMERVESSEGFGMAQAWDVGNALKYLLRAGRKDAIDVELGKAENYLHHARTGKWIGEEWIREGNDDERWRLSAQFLRSI